LRNARLLHDQPFHLVPLCLQLIVGEDQLDLIPGIHEEVLFYRFLLVLVVKALYVHALNLDFALIPQEGIGAGHIISQQNFRF
jgi:hypothetical protein